MKLIILLGLFGVGALFLLPKQKSIEGTWVLDTKNSSKEPAILRIYLGDGYYSAKLDIPGQQIFDRPVSIQLRNDSVKIKIDKDGDCFIRAVVRDSLISGISSVDGKQEIVSFYRLKR